MRLYIISTDRDKHKTVRIIDENEPLLLPFPCDVCTEEGIMQDGLPEGTIVSRYPDRLDITTIY